MADSLGYKWLSERYGILPVQPFRTTSTVGSVKRTEVVEGITRTTYPIAFIPAPTLAGHLGFAIKHEGIHLEFLARLFDKAGPADIAAWLIMEPTGAYARRAAFFYEWLTGKELPCEPVTQGNYVDALDPDEYLTATQPTRNRRWRVMDNLPGVPQFCPMVERTKGVTAAAQYDCAAQLGKLEHAFGSDILMRSAVWLTTSESRASFAIEREEKKISRIKLFAAVMENRIGAGSDPLAPEELDALQREILGPIATSYGMRRSPMFVGHTAGYTQSVDYIAPSADQIGPLLTGLRSFDERTKGQPAIIRAAALSYGFVYIHPMVDGNGRISRFLVNDTLRRDGAVPAPYILPISATIMKRRDLYDRSLELLSRPLMQHYRTQYRFGSRVQCEDGIVTNFEFDAYADALYAWRFPDLTGHVEYVGHLVNQTIVEEMLPVAQELQQLIVARQAVKDHMEAPDVTIDRIIRAIRENGGISNKLAGEVPLLRTVSGLADQIVAAVSEAFASPNEEPTDLIEDETGLVPKP